ncbi:MAG: ribosome maturation factor RimM [Aquabacterium sp.]|jgi:16S rRNA processing protein RimM|uniref:ribosome maturation factor RimM n=1 Tax=Aquabacterium sp. TaxID=1872578 RepID=UPI001B423FB5|nr:ribosome maturation factor RimM [Aquabacterium sp.]MBP6616233.1 ribosome maturation factor RimM [Aquabacterium sp.]
MNDRTTPSLVLDDGVVWPEDAVEVGRIVDAWGVKGGIKVMPFSSDPQALFCTKKWFLRPPEQAAGALSRPSAKTGAPSVAKPAAAAPARLTAPRFLQMTTVREQGDVIVGTAEGLDDRNDAEALKGARVFVSRSAFPTPEPDEYYWIDLIGLNVVNRQGEFLGQVADLMATGPHSVLRCVVPAAEGQDAVERLIPFVSAYIDSVSLADKRIVADWGLDY